MLPLKLSRRAHRPVVQRLDFDSNRHWQRRQGPQAPLRGGGVIGSASVVIRAGASDAIGRWAGGGAEHLSATL